MCVGGGGDTHNTQRLARSATATDVAAIGLCGSAHLDGGSGEARQLLDVLTLLPDDGADGQRRDEEVHRLRLLWPLLGHTAG